MSNIATLSSSMSLYSDPSAVAAAESAKARIQSAYMIALHRPRSYDNARLKILSACRRPDFAEKVEYKKPVGNSSIVGPSIRFAELALREWGNILYENQVVYDDTLVRRIRVTVIDLESNATFGKELQITKTIERKSNKGREVVSERLNSYGETVYTVIATDDELQTREAALISKALRNEGLRLIPQEIIEEGIKTARETMQRQDKSDPDAARRKLIDAFASLGVMPAEIEKFLGHPLTQCQPSEFQELRTMYAAIRDGEAKWSSFMEKDEPEKRSEDLAAQLIEQQSNGKTPPSLSALQDKLQRVVAEPVCTEQVKNENEGMDKVVTELEQLREAVKNMLGDAGLDLTAGEQAEFLFQHAGESELNKIPKPKLGKVLQEARKRIGKLDYRQGGAKKQEDVGEEEIDTGELPPSVFGDSN